MTVRSDRYRHPWVYIPNAEQGKDKLPENLGLLRSFRRDEAGNAVETEATIVFDKETNDPVFSTSKFRSIDLLKYVNEDGTKDESRQTYRTDGWGAAYIKNLGKDVATSVSNFLLGRTAEDKAKNIEGKLDRGHLIPNRWAGAHSFHDLNEVPESAMVNQDGSVRKAEEIASLFAFNSPDKDVEYSVVPDWNNYRYVDAVTFDGEKTTKRMPANLLITINGPHGKVAFYVPNSDKAMQEPTRYMVNKRWIDENMPKFSDTITKGMTDEEGYKGQMTSYLKNLAGNSKKPMMEAVKDAYMQSEVFRKQIERK